MRMKRICILYYVQAIFLRFMWWLLSELTSFLFLITAEHVMGMAPNSEIPASCHCFDNCWLHVTNISSEILTSYCCDLYWCLPLYLQLLYSMSMVGRLVGQPPLSLFVRSQVHIILSCTQRFIDLLNAPGSNTTPKAARGPAPDASPVNRKLLTI